MSTDRLETYTSCRELMNHISVVENMWYPWDTDKAEGHPLVIFNKFIDEPLNWRNIKKMRRHLGYPDDFPTPTMKYCLPERTNSPSPASMLLQLLEKYGDTYSPCEFIRGLRELIGESGMKWDNKITRVHRQIKQFVEYQ